MKKQDLLISYPIKVGCGAEQIDDGRRIQHWLHINRKKFDFERLLELEKKRRGVSPEQIIFLGTANLADTWCDQQTLYDCEDELKFFVAYLTDRLNTSNRLASLNKSFVFNKKSLLEVGNTISLLDINRLLNECKTPEASDDKKLREKRIAHLKKVKNSFERGEESQQLFAERHPSIRWNFPWKEYVIIGVPDGITDEFVYEYKSTKTRKSYYFAKLKADVQADLYGLFFERKKKRIQIRIEDEGKIETIESEVNVENALNALQRVYDLDHKNREIRHPSHHGSCKNCMYKKKCKIYKKLLKESACQL